VVLSKLRSIGAPITFHESCGMPPRLEASSASAMPGVEKGRALARTADLTRRQRDAKRRRWLSSIMSDIEDKACSSMQHTACPGRLFRASIARTALERMPDCVGMPPCLQAACGEGLSVHAVKGVVTGGCVSHAPSAGGVHQSTESLQAGEAGFEGNAPGMLQELGFDQVRHANGTVCSLRLEAGTAKV
jgi:hypothetical protein